MCPNDADGMANIVDPDQTAPELIWVYTCLAEYLGSLRCMSVGVLMSH